MIIQCRKCGTKYRFDKMNVTGKGVWVRCRNCETVFFQKNPLSEISSLMDLVDPERKIQEETEGQGERAEEKDSAVGEVEEESAGEEPTWEDAYQDAGQGIEIEGAGGEAPEEQEAEGAGAGEAETEPTWDDAYRDAGEGIEIEGAGEEKPKAEEIEETGAEKTETEPTWDDAYRDAGEGIEIEGAREEEAEETIAEEIEVEGGEPEPEGEESPQGTGEGIEGEGAGEEESRIAEGTEAGDTVEELEIEKTEEEKDRIAEGIRPEDAVEGPKWEETYEDVAETEDSEDAGGRQRVREPWALGDADEVMYNEKVTGKRKLRQLWTLVIKAVLYLVVIALLSGGVYLWLVPEAREIVSNRVFPWVEKTLGIEVLGGIGGVKEAVLPKVEKMLGIKDKGVPDEGSELRVTLIDVGERFVKGWTAENIMVVEGSAVNTNKIPVSNIGVRGKILDSSGSVLSEEESNCGTILTDDELKSLTRDEIKKELSNPYGRDFRNADIQPGDGIPFMLVFTMPAEEATELVVELIGIEAAKGK